MLRCDIIKRTKIITLLGVLIFSVLGCYNNQNVDALSGEKYLMYSYASGNSPEEYTLEEISYSYPYSVLSQAMVDSDPREPYHDRAVVKIEPYARLNGRNYLISPGTGFIIGDHEIMTAAHVVYSSSNAKYGHYNFSEQTKITILPPIGTINSNSITLNAVSVHIPKMYKTSEIVDYDFAILTVEEDLTQYGCYLLGMSTNNITQKNVPVHSLGFYGSTLKYSGGNIASNLTMSSEFDLYSTYGSSGGPIFVESHFGVPGVTSGSYAMKNYRTAISIVHGKNSLDSEYINGVRIRSTIMQFAYSNYKLN